jgi:ABC-type branched-subunit amino acid transport system ATPase component
MGGLLCCERRGLSRVNRLDRIVSDTVILTRRKGPEAALLSGGETQFRAVGRSASSDEGPKLDVEEVRLSPIIEEEEEEEEQNDAGAH